VEILKFAEPPKRSSRTNTKKRGGIMPLLAVVVSVAVVGGMSTTLAGTITLGTNNTVEFGQGVVTTAACDTSIKITPTSEFNATDSTFYVSTVKLENIGYEAGTEGNGCLGKTFTLKAYNAANTLLAADTGTATSFFITIPADTATATAGTFAKTSWVTATSPGGWNKSGDPAKTQSTGNGQITIGNLRISGAVTRMTLESSS
jgi:hypothetical protein